MTYCICGAPVSEHVLGRCERTNCKSFFKGRRVDLVRVGERITRCSECRRRPYRRIRRHGWDNHAVHCSRHGEAPNLSENQKIAAPL